jgi:hypothetical protein
MKMQDLRTVGFAFENRQGRSRHIPDRRYSILRPVPIVPAVQWFDRLTMAGSILRSSKDALRSRRQLRWDNSAEIGVTVLDLPAL